MEVLVPVGVRIDLPGATLEWYDEAIATTGYLPGGPIASRALSHWVTKTDDGICIIEVWESKEAFKNSAHQKSDGIVKEIGIPGRVSIAFFDVHNYLPGRSTRI
ncbi:MAG TPA: hypothetical protein VK215_07745 [Acidimicrobiales bacterium]|nr:hypothetical protein [Acidimicrobiales bacterium]HLN42332.1 hypothetical protein [Acidimicrobiales bacterium]